MQDIMDPDELDIEDTMKGKYLVFMVDKEEYGIEIKFVTEIIGIQSITPIPDLPEYIKGVINLRGKIIPVMDIRLRFGKEARSYDDRTCVIVVDKDNISVGLVVDSVSEVTSISDEEISPPPRLNKSFHKYIKGIGKSANEVKLLLDCERIVESSEYADFQQQ
ncbi:chemotaxis protein CheW [Syntrophomonas palmitatica]|uniref:chemotaxis protein CheW n=1 Tax=Syntrophomonas palmitatica TaxID=402877 RepID=UPI0006D034CE|nr:chemotaxis protein CheW [Syntrophomonas palmitatica]